MTKRDAATTGTQANDASDVVRDPAAEALLDRLASDGAARELVEQLEQGGATSARGASGSSTVILAGVIARATRRPTLLVCAHLDDADEAVDELRDFGLDTAPFPALEVLPGETSVHPELLVDRLGLVRRAAEGSLPDVIVAPIAALMQGVPLPARLESMLRTVREGETLDRGAFLDWLGGAGYARVESIEQPGDIAVRGGIIDVFPPGGAPPVRLDLFGDEVERIFEIDLATQASDRRVESVEFAGAATEALLGDDEAIPFVDLLPSNLVTVLAELAESTEQARGYWERVRDGKGVFGPPAVMKALIDRSHAFVDVNQFSMGATPERVVVLPIANLPPFAEETPAAFAEAVELSSTLDVSVFCDNEGERDRTRELLAEHEGGDALSLIGAHVHRGFLWEGDVRLAFVPQHELLHRYGTRRRVGRLRTGTTRETFLQFEPGDYVVHREHGIARFAAIGPLDGRSPDEEFLTLEFDGRAKLHVPAAKIDLVQKYVGAGGAKPTLSTVGGKRWKRAKEQAGEAVRDLAAEMLRVQAAREATPGIRYPADTAWQREFEAEFPYDETEDQISAIAATKRDMSGPRPMDRLICGDVGFGKTEVAVRAAFKAVEYGKQVAVLVPTTVLAEQHERTFRARFRAYPFRVESLSRFKTNAEAKQVLADLAAGRVDVVIGTHRILSKDVRFADLGLVVVDEEQRFGVEHKQRLLQFRTTADVMTLSATPIPRTLHMAMLGLRDISSLTTPPLDRRAVVTEVIPFNEIRIQRAMQRELAREGQIFFVHNRIHDLDDVAARIRRLVPEARVVVGHGKMSAKELEQVMLTFMRRQADVLVSTTIIESGIDIPTANTMFIDQAHIYGLAELHQLRGRVGRHKHRAYCYLLLPDDRSINEDAMKRLKAIEDYSMLGAGFRIAMRDLEIRGAGSLLGSDQSGHIAAVGYEMYCQLLERAVAELRNQVSTSTTDTILEIGVTSSIPRGYVPSDARRMEAYRRIGQADSLESLAQVEADLTSAYGDPPRQVRTLLDLAEVRLRATLLGVRSVVRRDDDLIFRTDRPDALGEAFDGVQGSLRVVGSPDARGMVEVYFRPPKAFLEPKTLMTVLRKRLA